MLKSTVCLSVLMKDEAHIIQRCLKSARPYVDAWCIVDTGSTDNGDTLAEVMMTGLPGQLHHVEWVNFGFNRAQALHLAAQTGCDYVLVVDSDNELVAVAERPDTFDKDYYNVCINEGENYNIWIPRLTLASRKWAFVGTTHEYLACITNEPTSSSDCTWWKLLHHHDGARRPRKAQEDEVMLRAELEANPENERVVFYLANVLRDQGKFDEALYYYDMRALMGGWHEEVMLSAAQAAKFRRGDFSSVAVPGRR